MDRSRLEGFLASVRVGESVSEWWVRREKVPGSDGWEVKVEVALLILTSTDI